MAASPTSLAFHLSVGVLVGLGLSGGSFTIVIAALGRLVPEDRRSWAMGLATAAGSLGQFVFPPSEGRSSPLTAPDRAPTATFVKVEPMKWERVAEVGGPLRIAR